MSTVEIIKWAAIILVAGLIGFFGRVLSRKLIERFERKEVRRLSKYESQIKKELKSVKKAKK